MSAETVYVTVYRSMDATAEEDCRTIVDLLTAAAIPSNLLDDASPDVPEGTWEVQVRTADAARAEEIVAANPLPDEAQDFDPSHDLDVVSIYHSEGSPLGEMEANAIKSVLESNGLMAMVNGDSVLPNMPFDVMVARDQADHARELLAEAQAAGPAAAEEASQSDMPSE